MITKKFPTLIYYRGHVIYQMTRNQLKDLSNRTNSWLRDLNLGSEFETIKLITNSFLSLLFFSSSLKQQSLSSVITSLVYVFPEIQSSIQNKFIQTLGQDHSMKQYCSYITYLDLIVIDLHWGCGSRAQRQAEYLLFYSLAY